MMRKLSSIRKYSPILISIAKDTSRPDQSSRYWSRWICKLHTRMCSSWL